MMAILLGALHGIVMLGGVVVIYRFVAAVVAREAVRVRESRNE